MNVYLLIMVGIIAVVLVVTVPAMFVPKCVQCGKRNEIDTAVCTQCGADLSPEGRKKKETK